MSERNTESKIETVKDKQGRCLELYMKYLEECYIDDCIELEKNYIVRTCYGKKINIPKWLTPLDLAGMSYISLLEAEAFLNVLKKRCRQPTREELMRYKFWPEGLTLYYSE
jgi:hypothetical protein